MPKTSATLIRRSRLTETSLIVHWCSPEHGLIKTVAKGALRPRSPFAGRLDLFFDAEIEFLPSRRSDLHTLKEAAVTATRDGIARGYPRVVAATYFVQLLEMTAERETPIPAFHTLLTRALDYLDTHPPSRKAVLRYEMRLAHLLGLPSGPDPGPVHVIAHTYHRLPKSRDELWAMIG